MQSSLDQSTNLVIARLDRATHKHKAHPEVRAWRRWSLWVARSSRAMTMFGVGAVMLVLAVTSPVRAASPDAELASARPVIEAANADWIPAMQAHDAARIASAYAEDGLFILPDGKVIAGRAAVEALTQKRFTPGFKVLSGGLTQDGLTYADGVIIEWGHGGLTSTDASGQTRTSSGPYLTVWKRDAAGQWRIIRNLVF